MNGRIDWRSPDAIEKYYNKMADGVDSDDERNFYAPPSEHVTVLSTPFPMLKV